MKQKIKNSSFLVLFEKKGRRRLTTILILINLMFESEAQQNITGQNFNVVSPSPISASINRYGDYPVSKFTGVPEISIPIYEIVSGDIVMPISISYHASGIKITDQSYPVGLGWTLNAGGRISRDIRDKPDDIDTYVSSGVLLPGFGSSQSADIILNLGDGVPDIFSYTTGTKDGVSGKFMFDGMKRYQNNSNKLVDPLFFPENDIKFKNNNHVYTLTDDKGIDYVYGGIPDYYSSNRMNWPLTEILPASKQSSDKITFSYETGPTLSTCTYEGSMTIIDSINRGPGSETDPEIGHFDYVFGLNSNQQINYTPPTPTSNTLRRVDHRMDIIAYESNYVESPYWNGSYFYQQNCTSYTTQQLIRIAFKGGYVQLSYYPNNGGLKQIQALNHKNEIIRTVEFYYTYSGSQGNAPYTLKKVVVKGSDNNAAGQEYNFEYEDAHVDAGNTIGRDFWGYYNGANFNATPIPKWEDVKILALHKANGNHTYLNRDIGTAHRECDPVVMKSYLIKKIMYPTGGYSEFEFDANQYYDEKSQLTKYIGGFRVKRIKTYDGINQPLIKEYSYGIDGPSGVGIPKRIPKYEDYVNERTLFYNRSFFICMDPDGGNVHLCTKPIPGIYARRRDFLSSPRNEISYSDGSAIWYTYIEEVQRNSNGDALGKTVYKYDLPQEDLKFNHSYYFESWQVPLQTTYLASSTGFQLPKLKEVSYYKSIGNTYEKERAIEYSYALRSKGTIYTHGSYLLQTANEGIPPSSSPPGVDYGKVFANLGAEYYSYSYKYGGEKVTDYSNGASSSKTVNYQYNSDNHLKPTGIITSNSKGFQTQHFKYAPDFENLTGQDPLTMGVKNLQTAHVISAPVEEVTESNGVIAAKLYQYNFDKPFLNKTYRLETSIPKTNFLTSSVSGGNIVFDPSYKPDFEADHYNYEGDLLEQHKMNDIHTCYLWGYNNMYPVAQVTGVNYTTVASLVDQTVLNNTLSTPAQIKIQLDNLRNGLTATKAPVTTYTYKPLVGMTSQTDPSGKTTYYEYDGFGRLAYIKDQNQNVVKKICYNYSGHVEDCFTTITPPPATVYVQITSGSINYSYMGNCLYQHQDFTLNFYQDEACTIPVNVNNLNVTVLATQTDYNNGSTSTSSYTLTATCSGSSTTLSQYLTYYSCADCPSGDQCLPTANDPYTSNTYTLAAGTGYTVK